MNKKLLLSSALSALVLTSVAQTTLSPAITPDEKVEAQVEKVLAKMTLEEKIGQMCQITVDVVKKSVDLFAVMDTQNATTVEGLKALVKQYGMEDQIEVTEDNLAAAGMALYNYVQQQAAQQPFEFNEEMLQRVIGEYKVGSILNVPSNVAQTRESWQGLIRRIQEVSMKEIGIPCIYGVDQIHGTTYTLGGTLFPQGANMGAAFNRALTRRGAEISAYETKAGNIPWTFAPVTDLGRDPRWSRMWENYGEDPYLNAEMGREAVLGFQGPDPNHIDANHVAACMKHFMGYGVPVSGKDRTPSSITVQDLREKHFAPYLEMVRNGALSVMINSAMNNGMPFHANAELLTGWLKEGLNWDGMVVTDWADIDNIWKRDHVAKDKKEAIKLAINAGIDMSMDPYSLDFCDLLKELVEEGEVPMSRIDDAVRRVLRLKVRLGLFDQPNFDQADYPLFGCAEHAADALQAAEESLVLLKNNDRLLPLAKGKKILLTGPNANSMRTLNGGWSYTWQGINADKYAADYNTILEALTAKYGEANITYEPGVTYNFDGSWWEENTPEIDKAVAAAADVDVIVACVGENSYCETPGNLTSLYLSDNQRDLVKALAKTGKPIVLIINSGRPRILADIEPLAQAVVDIMLPGNYGGDALANLLAGDANFSGKMSHTYPKEINSLVTYDYKPCEHTGAVMEGAYNYDAVVNVQWAFGYGLSYTTFAYSNLKCDHSTFTADDTLTFSVDVTNTGSMAGKESVLLFSSDLVASLTPDNRRLRNFDKVELQPGETKTVSLTLKGSDLAFVGYDGHWVLEEGDFRIQVGDQVTNVACSQTKHWDTQNKL